MSPLMLRQLWSVIEASQSQTLLNLDDSSLVQWLLKQLRAQRSLDHTEVDTFRSYIHDRLPLIRDLAMSRSMLHL